MNEAETRAEHIYPALEARRAGGVEEVAAAPKHSLATSDHLTDNLTYA